MVVIIVAALPLGIWLFLLLFWGNFWRADCRLDNSQVLSHYPSICAVIPARNEAEAIAASLISLLNQDYAGKFSIVLVDDNSGDRTTEIALETATQLGKSDRLKVITGKPLVSGWKGKLWAMHQGIESVSTQAIAPDYWLFTDADIQHDGNNLTQLVTKAETADLDLVSLMVLLRCQSFWEKLLIPAFVFFFQKLYPFAWANDPRKSMAAAAGGCILISNQALTSIGGVARIKNALIDDCTLAQAVKSSGKNIWLGLSETTISLRGYDHLQVIWDTIARTAYTQLNYSPLLLIGAVVGMVITYLIAPVGLVWGLVTNNWLLLSICIVTCLLMIWAYIPTIRIYKIAWAWGLLLPAIAFLYTLMTIDSAFKYYQGKGGAWKGRTYD
ncbi:glycosyl transferase family 2 [Pleurocapsa sp. CCALA 161]|uniref:glycosyltransferase n=1 Tax=Pleurocapsa sp. CCALA 161 TaxID=2107688 RepID=UPI000D05EFB0|nr:glycosyltransferase [Pleurocapsa sp. CCALA 161]PSB06574.1 glycosyl transferase family 2 [Pleurocapsa sp. CCALA 161]